MKASQKKRGWYYLWLVSEERDLTGSRSWKEQAID